VIVKNNIFFSVLIGFQNWLNQNGRYKVKFYRAFENVNFLESYTKDMLK